MRYEIDIFHYLSIYKKEWKRMAVLIVITIVITAVLQYIKPVTYRSTLIALSPVESGTGKIGGFLGLPQLSLGVSSTDIIFSMLKSARMRQDINEHFNVQDKPKFWWSLDTYLVTGGYAVEIKGSDPEMTKDIANFAVENLDKINLELEVTSQKPMVKILDPAVRGVSVGRNISKKVIATSLFVFTVYSLFIFFGDYLAHLKTSRQSARRG